MNKLVRELLPFGSLILIIAIYCLGCPELFLNSDNFLNVLRRSSVYGIIAVGMTFIIISGGIDLSVGSLLSLCGMCAAGTMIGRGVEEPTVGMITLGTGVGLLSGAVGGLVSGALITKLKLQPFIATLGTMSLYRGMALVMYDGQPINVSSYRYLGEGALFGIPISVVLFLGRHRRGGAILQFTRFGRHTYAIGSNVEAAHSRGRESSPNSDWHLHPRRVAHRARRDDRHEPNRLREPTAGVGAELDVIAAVVYWRRQSLRRPRDRHGNHRRHLAHQLLA